VPHAGQTSCGSGSTCGVTWGIDGEYYVNIHLLRENRVIAFEVRDGIIHTS
jgi:hypothetical protein